MVELKHVRGNNPINRVNSDVLARLVHAQSSLVEHAFPSAWELLSSVLEESHIDLSPPQSYRDKPVTELSDLGILDLRKECGRSPKKSNGSSAMFHKEGTGGIFLNV